MQRNFLLPLLVLLLLISLASAACEQNGAKALFCRFTQGDQRTFRISIDQKITQKVMGITQNLTQAIVIDYSYHVKKLNSDSSAVVEFTYNAISMKSGFGENTFINFDSSKPAEGENPLSKSFSSLIGKGFTCTITPQGRITEIHGIDALMQDMLQGLNLPEGAQTEEIKKQLKQSFGEDSIKDSFEKLTSIYPEKPIRIGDSWTRKATITRGLPMTMTTTWTLRDRKERAWIIDVKSVVEANKEAPPLKLGPLTMKYNLTGNQAGSFSVDEKTGFGITGMITQNFDGTVEMHVEGLQAGSEAMSWPITIESRITYEVPPKKEEKK
jgi:hypothetical protein